jgi:hypothetical protein
MSVCNAALGRWVWIFIGALISTTSLSLVGCRDREQPEVRIIFPIGYRGPYLIAQSDDAAAFDQTQAIVLEPDPRGVIRVSSLDQLHGWRKWSGEFVDGRPIPFELDAPRDEIAFRMGGTRNGQDQNYYYPEVMYGVVGTEMDLEGIDVRQLLRESGIAIAR